MPRLSHTHPQRHEHVQGNPAGNCQDWDASSSHIAIHHAAASHQRGRRHPSFLTMSMHRVLHRNAVLSSRMRCVTTWNENGSPPCSVSFSFPPSVSHYLVLSVQHLPQSPKKLSLPLMWSCFSSSFSSLGPLIYLLLLTFSSFVGHLFCPSVFTLHSLLCFHSVSLQHPLDLLVDVCDLFVINLFASSHFLQDMWHVSLKCCFKTLIWQIISLNMRSFSQVRVLAHY